MKLNDKTSCCDEKLFFLEYQQSRVHKISYVTMTHISFPIRFKILFHFSAHTLSHTQHKTSCKLFLFIDCQEMILYSLLFLYPTYCMITVSGFMSSPSLPPPIHSRNTFIFTSITPSRQKGSISFSSSHTKTADKRNTLVLMKLMKKSESNDNDDTPSSPANLLLDNAIVDKTNTIGIMIQPLLIWTSLYCVFTTGHGLPPGPFGLLGASEGIAYLYVLSIFAQKFIFTTTTTNTNASTSSDEILKNITLVTVVLAILTFLQLFASQGCLPNAKPLFDYSDYVTVCNPE